MTPEEFRTHGRTVIDWIADYMEHVEDFPVRSSVAPGEIRSRLPAQAPEQGEPFDAVMRDLDDIVMPGITHWQHPKFFAYFPANASGPAILGDLVASGLGVQGMLWQTSPACTEVETHVLDWLVEMLDLPRGFLSTTAGGGVIQDTASSATLCALLVARDRLAGSGSLTAYCSNQAHSSVEKAMMIAGLGRDNLRTIDVDQTFAMKPDALERAIAEDRATGHTPFFVCSTIGTTSSHGLDPLDALGPICAREDLWFHVDAAHAGTAALCPEFRFIHRGLEHADSYVFNPHKSMLTNFDCSCFWVTDRAPLIRTFSILPEYLRNTATESGAVFDYRDWHIPLGRRFRALKLWFVIRHYGVEGLQTHVRNHVASAQWFADQVRADDDFELAVDPPLSLVCFRHRGGEAVNERLMADLNDSGDLYLTHTRLDDRFTLRLAVGSATMRHEHVEQAWDRITETAGRSV